MFKFFTGKKAVPVPEQNPWGDESPQKSSEEGYSFSNSTWAALQFVFAALNRNLPPQIQRHIRFDESSLPKDLRLYKILRGFGIQDHGTGRYRDRTLHFSFTEECDDGTCLKVYLRQYAGSKTWKVVSMTYTRKYNGNGSPKGGCSYEQYEVVVEPYLVNEGTEHASFAKSGFRISSY